MEIILEGIVGSTAYGLAHEDSDIDKLGIYRAPLREAIGLNATKVVSDSVVTHDPDTTYHEVGKYLSLALKCNPTILELLFLPSYTRSTPLGRKVLLQRENVLSEKAVRGAYGAYAYAQAKRLMERSDAGKEGFGSVPVNRIKKHARHCGRLLTLGQQLLETGSMTLDVSHIRQELFLLGELAASHPHEFYKAFEHRLAIFDNCKSVLPEQPNRTAVHNTLGDIRLFEYFLLAAT